MKLVNIKTPDLGIDEALVIEILIKVGDVIEDEDSLITLESDKSSMEVPTNTAGKITKILVNIGDKIKAGDPIAQVEATEIDNIQVPSQSNTIANNKQQTYDFDVAVIGGGPGGYTAAFRAADLGLKVALIERYPVLGGVCLNVGCIPSKTLLHSAQIIQQSKQIQNHGISLGEPKIDLNKLRNYKNSITTELNQGLYKISQLRKITFIQGISQFKDTHHLQIKADKNQTISFEYAIIATGSHANQPSFIPKHKLIWDSTDALELKTIPKRLMVLGGGIIGLEMATIYHALGSEITIIEMGNQLIPEADRDMLMPLQNRISKEYKAIYTRTKATKITPSSKQVKVDLDGNKAPKQSIFDAVLVAIGRSPNNQFGAKNINIQIDAKGFITTDERQRTNIDNIFAIGDVVGQPMLAHKATHQAKVAAQVIADEHSSFSPMSIPSVAYTHPEIAWVGKTEKQLKVDKTPYYKGKFPWQASGRALASRSHDGISKTMFCKQTDRLLGAGIVGANAGDIICEAVLALEMGATAEDIGLSIHPHPTLGESFAMSAEMAAGTITDILPDKSN